MIDFARLKLIPRMPDYFDPQRGDPIPADIVGATIIGFGTADSHNSLSGGGLIIDYAPIGKTEVKRLVLVSDDTAISVRYCEPVRENLSI